MHACEGRFAYHAVTHMAPQSFTRVANCYARIHFPIHTVALIIVDLKHTGVSQYNESIIYKLTFQNGILT